MRKTAANTELIAYMEACPHFKDREISKYERLGYCRHAETICLLQENPCSRFKRYKRILRMKQAETLHLVLKSKWFAMIAKGEKKEEYREVWPVLRYMKENGGKLEQECIIVWDS